MERYLLALWIAINVSTRCHGVASEIRFPPFPDHDRKGSYDLELKRTEVLNGKAFRPVEGSFHVDVTETAIRVVTKRLTFSFRSPKYQSESIYSNRNISLLTINTETGTKPSEVVYGRDAVNNESAFYSDFHGVSIINGCFSNSDGSLWDIIKAHADEVIANKPVLPQGVELELLKHDDYWLLRRVRIHLEKGQERQLYSTKFYAFKPPSDDPISITEKLDWENAPEEHEPKYYYELSCKYENNQTEAVQMEILIKNYQPEVATPPLTDDGVYTPTIVTIPNGTNVGIVGEQTIEYMWHDGRIVRRINRKAVDAAKSVSFPRGSRSRVIWAGASLISLFLIIAVWIWLRRKAKASP